jgi:hypothetical protein
MRFNAFSASELTDGLIRRDWQKRKNSRQTALCYVLTKRKKRAAT